MAKEIHYTDWGAQGDSKIACTQTWHQVDHTYESPNPEVRKSFDGIFYTANGDQVTCGNCQDIIRENKASYAMSRHKVKVLDFVDQDDGSAIVNLDMPDKFMKEYVEIYELDQWDQEHFNSFFLNIIRRGIELSDELASEGSND